jgi:hypothetical protein
VVLTNDLDTSRRMELKTGTKLYKKSKNALVVCILNASLETDLKGIKTCKVVLALANTGLLHNLELLTKTCKKFRDVLALVCCQISRPEIVVDTNNDVFDVLLCTNHEVFDLIVCTKKVVPNALASPPSLAANVAELIPTRACHVVAAARDQVDYSSTLLTHLPALLAGQV